MARRESRPPPNPMARPLAIVAFTTLGIVGVAALADWDGALDRFAKPLLLACAVAVALYTIRAVRLGWIATIGPYGQIWHYRRRGEPILFWLLVALYLGLAVPTGGYMGILLLDS